MKNICFYLPQFHDEKLNDEFWEPGFSDWTTSQNMYSLYPGHIQPKVPVNDLYNLENVSVLSDHCDLAKSIGIDGFCFYYYQFNKELSALRKPLDLFAASDIQFPFCISWANHSWSKAWIGDNATVIAEQCNDNETIDKFLSDLNKLTEKKNYIKIGNSFLLKIVDPDKLDLVRIRTIFLERYKKTLYIVAPKEHEDCNLEISWPPGDLNFHRLQSFGALLYVFKKFSRFLGLHKKIFKYTNLVPEKSLLKRQLYETTVSPVISQTILTGWDNTPRYKFDGYVVTPTTAENYVTIVRKILSKNRSNGHPVSFIKAWNEWAEGNVIEEKVNDLSYLDMINDALDN
jgi:hypothetical protein